MNRSDLQEGKLAQYVKDIALDAGIDIEGDILTTSDFVIHIGQFLPDEIKGNVRGLGFIPADENTSTNDIFSRDQLIIAVAGRKDRDDMIKSRLTAKTIAEEIRKNESITHDIIVINNGVQGPFYDEGSGRVIYEVNVELLDGA